MFVSGQTEVAALVPVNKTCLLGDPIKDSGGLSQNEHGVAQSHRESSVEKLICYFCGRF